MPTLWGFMEFNYAPTSEVGEVHTEPATVKPVLKAATWEYPDDCFYIKMYVLCPLSALQTALGPCHRYDDEKKRGVWAWA